MVLKRIGSISLPSCVVCSNVQLAHVCERYVYNVTDLSRRNLAPRKLGMSSQVIARHPVTSHLPTDRVVCVPYLLDWRTTSGSPAQMSYVQAKHLDLATTLRRPIP